MDRTTGNLPLSRTSGSLDISKLTGTLPVSKGGTGTTSLNSLKTSLGIQNITTLSFVDGNNNIKSHSFTNVSIQNGLILFTASWGNGKWTEIWTIVNKTTTIACGMQFSDYTSPIQYLPLSTENSSSIYKSPISHVNYSNTTLTITANAGKTTTSWYAYIFGT